MFAINQNFNGYFDKNTNQISSAKRFKSIFIKKLLDFYSIEN